MSNPEPTNLESAFAGVADNYRGTDVDLHAIYRDMRKNSPVIAENFMARLGVPSIAGLDANRPTFTLFKYKDVMAVLLMPPTSPAASSPRAWGHFSTD
ncbi:hypothetical protein LP415_14525 [Polaromonas sp. P1(28)-8]|nr:hypothetical protein LP415_14525 [Polaromonas sp. P1(28)-8]